MAVSPSSIAPWGDRSYRLSHTAQLVEGGSAAYWLTSPVLPPQYLVDPDVIQIESPSPDFTLDSIILWLALNVGNEVVERILTESHNIEIDNKVRKLAPYWEISEQTRKSLAAQMSGEVRLAFTVLDELNLLTEDVWSGLRDSGFDFEVFRSSSK
jgi:hypothetical protein